MTLRLALATAALALAPVASAQPAARADAAALAGYYRAVGEHFRVPPSEIAILSEWRLPPEEIPVVLWLAGKGGISPDAVVALRQAGRDWSEIARRYALDAAAFHVPLDGGAGSLGHAYQQYRELPPGRWREIALDDGEIVGLVNLRVLSEMVTAPAATLLQARDRSGSWVDAYRAVGRR